MTKLYEPSASDQYRSFLFEDDLDEDLEWQDSYAPHLLASFGHSLATELTPLAIVLNPDEKKKKTADISLLGSNSLLVLSAKAHACLKDKLQPCGQFAPLASADECFIGFHVTRVLQDAVIWAASDYREQDAKKILYTPTLKQSSVEGNYVFMLQESQTRIYVSSTFFEDCERHGLTGIDWAQSKHINTSE
ncbi:putative uncharacterized protein [Pseudomonas sp. StFLB209]|uniref:imm11 family protein n=1 Tax=Pseudomonas sp. StFLB209 TaxID=1028989 RepID=UPI0004F76BBA|nr:hypothetical protein [Pseudomonas sp. StFLB209]BAP42592.1 putative uncharacterized protein [Pseudomonas sp. StFLB209]